ncbi:MAG TPA: hypothetical protein VJU87_02965 [Gemmatimonadaceae bacterium]|nr:hypothetical protein [Gemmatimonadaceae bacterium]
MLTPRQRRALALVATGTLALLGACHSGTEPKGPVAAQLTVLPGNTSGLTGTSLVVAVKVTSTDNRPVPNATVTFAVVSGDATVSPTTAQTDNTGTAQTTVTFGPSAGPVKVSATVSGTNLAQSRDLIAIAPVTDCNASAAATLNLGEVRTPIAAQDVCVSGGASGADFAVIPFNGSVTYSATASMSFFSQGASAPVGSASRAPAGLTPLFSVSPAPSLQMLGGFGAPRSASTSYELRLRQAERQYLTPLVPAARAWYSHVSGTRRPLAPLYDKIPSSVTVGQLLKLNTRSGDSFADACQTPDMRTGRVVAVTNRAVVVADTANPSGGYTDADYQSIGTTFDTLVYDTDVSAFGAPSDIDNNGGRMLLFFTRAVNELTPKNSTSIVGGFFYGRDLFPQQATTNFDACPTSNVGEMFYLLVPDPTGVVNGNVRSKSDVTSLTISTTAHEFQHLINASRRMFVNDANDFEEVWLNEGLSHIAEELLFYRESAGLTPRENLDAPTIRSSAQSVDAFNNDQINNMGRYIEYLKRPSTSSPYAPDDSLWTRGATWSFLRYAADHRGASDGDVWFQLDNSKVTGLANLQNVFGAGLTNIFRDWATSVLTDDLVSTDPAYQQPSWNFRSIFPALQVSTFPLQTVTITDTSPASLALNGGSVAFLRFSVPAGQTASVQWGVPPQDVQVTLVRTR